MQATIPWHDCLMPKAIGAIGFPDLDYHQNGALRDQAIRPIIITHKTLHSKQSHPHRRSYNNRSVNRQRIHSTLPLK
eukprot:13574868-Ditylum_brightwellii.AAC.1